MQLYMSGKTFLTCWKAKGGGTANLKDFLQVELYCTYPDFYDWVNGLKCSFGKEKVIWITNISEYLEFK